MNGTRRPLRRSKRRAVKTGTVRRPDGVGTARPPPLPTGRAPSSPLPSGSPATRRPCAETWRSTDGHPLSRTVALGRAPPSEVPGARINRRSSSVSWSSITRVVAASRRGRSTTGGTCPPVEVRNTPPAASLNRSAPSRVSSSTSVRNVDRLQRSRLPTLRLSPPPFVAPQERLPPAVGRGVGEGVEQGPVGMERPACRREDRIDSEGVPARQPRPIVLEGGRLPGPARPRPERSDGNGLTVQLDEDQDLTFHVRHPRIVGRTARIRRGSRSSSRLSPTGSRAASITSPSRSAIPSTKSTEA